MELDDSPEELFLDENSIDPPVLTELFSAKASSDTTCCDLPNAALNLTHFYCKCGMLKSTYTLGLNE